ncbi:unnamed protein product [Rotaria sordida]|uniref:Ig-like domain-containing protein n=1 Tax=Rotaria sordida TaxID=392033 RepID=A0A819JJK9_9BILA|nr:unnamed protein product [Rotaria sordida]CAF3935004.1 unnamed protein product [Rotaria sordida]
MNQQQASSNQHTTSTSIQQSTLSSLSHTISSSSSFRYTTLSSSSTNVTKTSSVLFITQRLVDMTIEQGKLLKLLVKSSQSSNEVIWYKNDGFNNTYNETKKLNNNNKYHLITQNKIHILIISNVTVDDAGEYICRIENDLTHARIQMIGADFNIIPQLPPSSINISTLYDVKGFEDELKFIESLPDRIHLYENEQLILLCEINRKPKKVQWFKDDLNMSLERNNSLVIYDIDEISILIINNFIETCSGRYTCYIEDSIKTVFNVEIEDTILPFIDQSLTWMQHINEPVEIIYFKLNKANILLKWFHQNENNILPRYSTQYLSLLDVKKKNLNKYFILLKLLNQTHHFTFIDLKSMMITNSGQNSIIRSLPSIQQKQITEGDTLIIKILFQKPSQWIIRLSDIDLTDFGLYSIEFKEKEFRQDLFILSVKPRSIQRQIITLRKDEFYSNETIAFEDKFQRPLYSKTYRSTWFKNGLPIQSSNRHLIITEGTTQDQSIKYSLRVTDKYQPTVTINVTMPSIVLLNPGDEDSLTSEPVTKKQKHDADYWTRRAVVYQMGSDEYFLQVQVPSASSTLDATTGGQTRPLLGHSNEFEVAQRQWLDTNERHRAAAAVVDDSSSMNIEGDTDQSDYETF